MKIVGCRATIIPSIYTFHKKSSFYLIFFIENIIAQIFHRKQSALDLDTSLAENIYATSSHYLHSISIGHKYEARIYKRLNHNAQILKSFEHIAKGSYY